MPNVSSVEACVNVQSLWIENSGSENSHRLSEVFSPSVLSELSVEAMEVLLGLLPQVGALQGRIPGTLRIVSAGYHCHIQGNDPRCPYPVDFFVRASGVYSTIVMALMLPSDKKHITRELDPQQDFLRQLRTLNEKGVCVRDFELALHKQFRPGAIQAVWSVPGGVRAMGQDPVEHAKQELQEEAPGLTLVSDFWRVLHGFEYQEGNIPEQHTFTYVLCGGKRRLSSSAQGEGIREYGSQRIGNLAFPDTSIDAKVHHAVTHLLAECGRKQIA